MRSRIVANEGGPSARAARPAGAVRFAGWLIIGQSAVFVAGAIFAIRELARVSTMPVEAWESTAEVDRFRTVMTSVARDRVVIFVLLGIAFLVVGSFLTRRPSIGPRIALLGLNVLLAVCWAFTVLLSVYRLDESDVVYGTIESSGLATGLGYVGLIGAGVAIVVDALALANPSTELEQPDPDWPESGSLSACVNPANPT